MNETLKTILERRSIRKYKQEQIKEKELQAILEAGRFAPSAKNQQPWHFTVIQSKEMLIKINETCKAILIKAGNKTLQERIKDAKIEDFNMLYNAPTLIIVSGDENAVAPQNDCSLALENMFLAAESLGIGSCWIHAIKLMYSEQEGKDFLIREKLIPEGYFVVGSGTFGYKAIESHSAAPRRENVITMI